MFVMDEELINRLMRIAKELKFDETEPGVLKEDAMVYDYSSSNVDDAYEMGLDDGEINLARDILDKLGVTY